MEGAGRFAPLPSGLAYSVLNRHGNLHSGECHARLMAERMQHDPDLEFGQHFPPPRVIGIFPFLRRPSARPVPAASPADAPAGP